MASRNLTSRFIEMRMAHRSKGLFASPQQGSDDTLLENDSAAESAATGGWSTMRTSLPPIYVDKIEQAENDFKKIQQKMRELSQAHTRRLMPTFDTDEREHEAIIDTLTNEITAIFRHAELALKAIQDEDDTNASAAEMAIRNNMQRSMARKLQQLSMLFRSSQKVYLKKVQAQKAGNDDFAFIAENQREIMAAPDKGFTQEQLVVLEETEKLVDERDSEITAIAKSIEELAQIFKELAVLVIDQGTILDRIDFNMENVVEHTKEGITQLEQAETYQKGALPMRCIIVLVVLIAIMVLVMIFKHLKKK